MKLSMLTKEQVKKVYYERMKADFPPNELKPLAIIDKAVEQGSYECLGLMDGEEIAGYVFLIKHGEDYLIDYLAIYPERRNQGLGGELIRLLGAYLVQAKSIIGEVENPELAKSEEDRRIQTRRFAFYRRNGFRDTGVRAACFGVPYIIIEMGQGLVHTTEEVKVLYERHYRAILPKGMFEKNVIVQDRI